MSGSSKGTLRQRLLQLKCHFTWKILLSDMEPENLENSLYDQLTFLVTKNKYMVHNLLAYVMHLQNDYTKAIVNLEKAEEMIKENNPDGADQKYLVTYGNYAWVYYFLEKHEDSQKYLDKVEQIYKELKGAQDTAEIYGEKGWSLLKFCGQYYDDAQLCFQKALELDPEDPEWITGYATVVYRLEDFPGRTCPASECKSLELLKTAVKKNPNDPVVKALLALKLQDLNRTGEGKKYIEKAVEQAPNSPYLLRYVAKFYRRAEMVDEALCVLKTALDLIPTSGFLHHQVGQCYRKKYFTYKKQFENSNVRNGQQGSELRDLLQNALFNFEKTVEYKKTFAIAYVDLAKMYCEAKEYKKADDKYKIIVACSNLMENDKQQIYYNYGYFKEQYMRSESEAIDYYKKSLKIKSATQERKLSEKSLKRISAEKLRINIRDAEGYALLGFVHKTIEEKNEAIDCYKKASKYNPYNEEYVSELCELKMKI